MVVDDKKVVSISYTLRSDGKDGNVEEVVNNENPLVFLYGSGNLLPEFEKNLAGLKVGEEFNFDIDSANGYGEVIEEAVVDVPKNIFMIEGKLATELLEPEKVIPMQDSEGNPIRGKVLEVADESVKMDFNHPMAGKDLHFSGKVEDVREPNEEELEHGHAHGEGGVQH